MCFRILKIDPEKYVSLTPAFIHILKQILNARLPNHFEYHGCFAPWIQISCIRILGMIAPLDIRQAAVFVSAALKNNDQNIVEFFFFLFSNLLINSLNLRKTAFVHRHVMLC